MKRVIPLLIISALVAIFIMAVPNANAADCGTPSQGINAGVSCAQPNNVPTTLFGGSSSIFTTVVNTLLFFIGAVSVIMLIYGGIRYTLSAGNSANVTAAKNIILYAIVGLIVAFLAFALVNFVLGALSPGSQYGFTNV